MFIPAFRPVPSAFVKFKNAVWSSWFLSECEGGLSKDSSTVYRAQRKEKEGKVDRRRGGWEDNIKEWTGICFANSVNPIVLRKAKIVFNFGLSECSRVKEAEKEDKVERDCSKAIFGAPMTLQDYGIE